MERESLRGLWKRCITCVFVQNFGFVSQPNQHRATVSQKRSHRPFFMSKSIYDASPLVNH